MLKLLKQPKFHFRYTMHYTGTELNFTGRRYAFKILFNALLSRLSVLCLIVSQHASCDNFALYVSSFSTIMEQLLKQC